jgi:uridine phosphorylase
VTAFEEWQMAEAVLADYVEEHRLPGDVYDAKTDAALLAELQQIVEAARERVESEGRSVSGSRFFGVVAGESITRLPNLPVETFVLAWEGEQVYGIAIQTADPGQRIGIGRCGKRWRHPLKFPTRPL